MSPDAAKRVETQGQSLGRVRAHGELASLGSEAALQLSVSAVAQGLSLWHGRNGRVVFPR